MKYELNNYKSYDLGNLPKDSIKELEEYSYLAALDGSVSAEIIKLNVLAPLDASAVVESVRKTGRLVVVEECFATGGMGQQICAALERAGVAVKELKLLSCGSDFVHQGSVAQLYHSLGIDAEGIRTCVNEVCHGESKT